jgi:hypothetical protein
MAAAHVAIVVLSVLVRDLKSIVHTLHMYVESLTLKVRIPSHGSDPYENVTVPEQVLWIQTILMQIQIRLLHLMWISITV